MDQSGVGVKHFTGRSVCETLVLGYCDDDTSSSEALHNLPCSGLVNIGCPHASVLLVLRNLAALKLFVVRKCFIHGCSAF